jgi:hypothetical protein
MNTNGYSLCQSRCPPFMQARASMATNYSIVLPDPVSHLSEEQGNIPSRMRKWRSSKSHWLGSQHPSRRQEEPMRFQTCCSMFETQTRRGVPNSSTCRSPVTQHTRRLVGKFEFPTPTVKRHQQGDLASIIHHGTLACASASFSG